MEPLSPIRVPKAEINEKRIAINKEIGKVNAYLVWLKSANAATKYTRGEISTKRAQAAKRHQELNEELIEIKNSREYQDYKLALAFGDQVDHLCHLLDKMAREFAADDSSVGKIINNKLEPWWDSIRKAMNKAKELRDACGEDTP